MDHSYSDIEAIIREANRQRSEAMGNLISAGWKALKQFLARLKYHRPTATGVVTNASALIGIQQLP